MSEGEVLSRMTQSEKNKINKQGLLTVQLKNAVMYHLVKNRSTRRVFKLKEVLTMVIEKKKKEMAMARK